MWGPRWCETALFDDTHMRFVSWAGWSTLEAKECDELEGYEYCGQYGSSIINVKYVCSGQELQLDGSFAYTPRWVDRGHTKPALSHSVPPPAAVSTYLHHLTDRPFEMLRMQEDRTVVWKSGRVVQHLTGVGYPPGSKPAVDAAGAQLPAFLLVELCDEMACVPSHHIKTHNWRWDSYLHSGARPATLAEQLAVEAAAAEYASTAEPDAGEQLAEPWWRLGFKHSRHAFKPPKPVGGVLVFADAPVYSQATKQYEWQALELREAGVFARAGVPAGTLIPYLLNTNLLPDEEDTDMEDGGEKDALLQAAAAAGGVSRDSAADMVHLAGEASPVQRHMMAAWSVRNATLGEDVNCCCVRIPTEKVLQPFYYAQLTLGTEDPCIPYILVLEDVPAGAELVLPEGELHTAPVSAVSRFTYTSHLRKAYDSYSATLAQAAAAPHPYPHPNIKFPATWWHISPEARSEEEVPCVVEDFDPEQRPAARQRGLA